MKIILFIIVIEIIIISLLIAYNIYINKNLTLLEKSKERISKLLVLGKIVEIVGLKKSVQEKITEINNILIETFNTRSSTLVYFDGTEYKVKATNIQEDTKWITKLNKLEMFKESINNNQIKYIKEISKTKIEEYSEPIEKEIFDNLLKMKTDSMLFIPLISQNLLLGYWILEDESQNSYINIDFEILKEIRKNIIDIMSSLQYEKALETFVRKDEFSTLKSVEYLLTEGKRKLDTYNYSTILMFKLDNLIEINQQVSREAGNQVIREISRKILEMNIEEAQFIRFFGPKFVVVFEGKTESEVADTIKEIVEKIEETKVELIVGKERINNEINDDIYEDIDNIDEICKEEIESDREDTGEIEEQEVINVKVKTVSKIYYSGTEIDYILKSLEQIIDEK